MTYRAKLSSKALRQLNGLPALAFDGLVKAMADVIEYPDDPLRTFPTRAPYVRRVDFARAGLATYRIDDGAEIVLVLDVTWAG